MLVGGLCPQCVARSVQVDFLASAEADLEDKEPLSVNVQGYEIQELIGGGGMGEVYHAIMTARGREVAMKVVAGRLTRDPETVARFEAEVAALSQLNHPNVMRVLDHGEMANGRHFLVMEYVDGCDLRRLLRAQRLETDRAFDIFLKVCAGVIHAHEHGLVHRDIKPANILIGLDGTVKVADFGLAKTLVETSVAYGFTQTRDTFGTPYYVAPEVTRRAGDADMRTDVYALGVLLYELLTGAVPMGQFTPLSKRTGLDRKLDSIVASALADDPQMRTPTVQEMVDGVGEVVKRYHSGAARQIRSRKWLALVSVMAVLGVGVAVGSWFTSKRASKTGPNHVPPQSATREAPWTNSLGMKFVPIPDTRLLCSIWETRVRDYEAFSAADNAVMPDWRTGANSPRDQIRRANRIPKEVAERFKDDLPEKDLPTWRDPGPAFQQTPDHPVCGMDLIDARLFCAWLTWKERMEKRITERQNYRLPTDDEWSLAAGLTAEQERRPSQIEMILKEDDSPFLEANFAGPEIRDGGIWPMSAGNLPNRDPFSRTGPVGSFKPNKLGIYDLSGNLSEWTDTESAAPGRGLRKAYFMRGGSWATAIPRGCRLEARQIESLGKTRPTYGFRVVLDLSAPAATPRVILGTVEEEGEVEKKAILSSEK